MERHVLLFRLMLSAFICSEDLDFQWSLPLWLYMRALIAARFRHARPRQCGRASDFSSAERMTRRSRNWGPSIATLYSIQHTLIPNMP